MNLAIVENHFEPHLYLNTPVQDSAVQRTTMRYFDKDGYELNDTEQLYYHAQSINIAEQHLSHTANHVAWIIDVDNEVLGATLDHSILVQRWAYTDEAREQIIRLSKQNPLLNKLLSIKPKWGTDISLDYVYPGGATELFHVEYDHCDYDTACEMRDRLADLVRRTDWEYGAQCVMNCKARWEHLCSDDQSDWKVKYFGWHRAFDNQKVLD